MQKWNTESQNPSWPTNRVLFEQQLSRPPLSPPFPRKEDKQKHLENGNASSHQIARISSLRFPRGWWDSEKTRGQREKRMGIALPAPFFQSGLHSIPPPTLKLLSNHLQWNRSLTIATGMYHLPPTLSCLAWLFEVSTEIFSRQPPPRDDDNDENETG